MRKIVQFPQTHENTEKIKCHSLVDNKTETSIYLQEMKRKTLTAVDVIRIMRQRQGERSDRQFAIELGVSNQTLSKVYRGKQEPSAEILAKLNIERRIVYEQVA